MKSVVRATETTWGNVYRKIAQDKDSLIEEIHLVADHVYMMISIPPKYAVSNVVGYFKGTSTLNLALTYSKYKRNFAWQSLWARGCFPPRLVGASATLFGSFARITI
jgi:REP element-mobilizing transposase RayT